MPIAALGRSRFWRAAALYFLAMPIAWLGGCAFIAPQAEALREHWPAGLNDRVELSAVPFFAQDDYQCGPAALATLMAHRGLATTPETLVPQVYLPARQGSLQIEMLAAPRAAGLVTLTLAPQLNAVLREVQAGNPVIVLQDLGLWPVAYWHYAVVFGFEREQAHGLALLRSGLKPRVELPLPVLEISWRSGQRWAMVAMPPERVAATATETQWLAAVHAMEGAGAPAKAARSGYASALTRWPASINAAIALANVDYGQGALADAETVLRQALQHDPRSAPVLNNLAQVVSDLGRHGEALALLDRALAEQGPFQAAALATRDAISARLNGAPQRAAPN